MTPFTKPAVGNDEAYDMTLSAPKMTPDELKETLLTKIGDISAYSELFPTKILCAVFVREKIGSIITSSGSQKEDVYQGKSFLVLKLGAAAFLNTEGVDFHGFSPKVGDWVEARPADGEHLQLNGQDCRIFHERDIRGILSDPTIVF
jgi:co-chaperonin GroES (HSP10)